MKYETYLPCFNGFYGSHYESEDSAYIDSENSELINELDSDNYNFDYSKYYWAVSQKITDYILEQLKDENLVNDIIFEELRSPKEYNFTNDSINCEIEITEEQYHNIVNMVLENKEAFNTYIIDNYKSRSGFISFINCSSELWIDQLINKSFEKPQHQIGSILNFICTELLEIEDIDIYYSVSENTNISEFVSYNLETLNSEQLEELKEKEYI